MNNKQLIGFQSAVIHCASNEQWIMENEHHLNFFAGNRRNPNAQPFTCSPEGTQYFSRGVYPAAIHCASNE
jgi:hypothetical protein